MIAGFDWDEGNWPKCAKHGLGKDEIESVFHAGPAVQGDPTLREERLRAIGTAASGRHVYRLHAADHRREDLYKTDQRPLYA